jgi:hypothetical protein
LDLRGAAAFSSEEDWAVSDQISASCPWVPQQVLVFQLKKVVGWKQPMFVGGKEEKAL